MGKPGLFLDLDGTLADSLSVMRGVYDRFLAEFERTGSAEEFDQLNGPSLLDLLEILKHNHNLELSTDKLLSIYKAFLRDAYALVSPNKGARELIEVAIDEGWVVNVVSSNVSEIVVAWLKKVELADSITVIATSDIVSRGKPAPDLYVKALRDSGCAVDISLAVEDTVSGVRSAIGAGLRTCALVNEGSRKIDWPEGVDTITGLDQLLTLVRNVGESRTPYV